MATTTPRDRIDERLRWNTAHLFASDASWERARRRLQRQLPAIAACRGTFRQGGDTAVLDSLQLTFSAHRALTRLASYAARRHDEDTRVPRYQAQRELMEKLRAAFAEASAFIEPELLALPARRLRAMIADEAFGDYQRFIEELLRRRPHVLKREEEALLAATSLMRDAGHTAYATFCGAELTFPEIEDERGRGVRLTQATFPRYRASQVRRVRKAAFQALLGTFGRYSQTLAATLSAQVNANVIHARVRRYGSALEAALDADALPPAVHRRMLAAVRRHLPVLHRYLRLRRRLLGVRQLRYHDLYPPMVEKVQLRFPYDKARTLLLAAAQPMGRVYCEALARGLDPANGWIDPLPNQGKRSGAYMDGSAYDVHPYVLGNYIGDYNSLGMLAHEMGHAMHSYFSNRHQPYPKADYAIFVAEVASTLNEALLAAHLLRRTRSRRRRLFLLGEQLENFRQTLFRQAMFAEFEADIYQRVEQGEALTADLLTRRYLQLVREYYGHEERVVLVDEPYGAEWAYIPHFYYNFYVFQYATGITAATALAEGIKAEGEAAADRYFERLLCAGCSAPPTEILARAGVDLTSDEPYDVAVGVFERTIAEVEALL